MPGIAASGASTVRERSTKTPAIEERHGTVACERTEALAQPARFQSEGGHSMPPKNMPMKKIEVQVRKPTGRTGH
jgi:hypothetical protein